MNVYVRVTWNMVRSGKKRRSKVKGGEEIREDVRRALQIITDSSSKPPQLTGQDRTGQDA